MTRERIGSFVLRAYPLAVRLARGPEMLSMLLDAGEQSRLAFMRECGSLLAGGVRERAHAHRVRILLVAPVMIVAILALGAVALGLKISKPAQNRSNMERLAGALAPRLRDGDLVLVAAPEQTPVAYKYLPDGLRYATPLGLDAHPGMTYHNIYSSLARSSPQAVLDRVLTTLNPGQHLLFIRPLTAAEHGWASRRSALIRLRAAQLGAVLAHDRQLRVVHLRRITTKGACCVTDSAQLYVET